MNFKTIFTVLFVAVISLTNIAHAQSGSGRFGNVYAMDNNPQQNRVVAYLQDRRSGFLFKIGAYQTGGQGAGDNAAADPLGSQGSVIVSPNGRNLYVVNAGSDDISVFRLRRFGIPQLIQKISSNGDFPVSLAIDDDVLYVLNAGSDGAISGYTIQRSGRLSPIANSTRALGLGQTTIPVGDARNLAPGDIAFDTLSRRLLIAYAGGGDSGQLLSFELNDDDTPGDTAVETDSEGPVPFSLDFSDNGSAIIAEASGSLSSYNYSNDNSLVNVSSAVANGQAATCWVLVGADNNVYTTNTVSGTISHYTISRNGELTLVDAVAGSNIGLPTDFTISSNGRFMYVVGSSDGNVIGFRIRSDGSLQQLGSFSGLPNFDADGFAPQGIAVR